MPTSPRLPPTAARGNRKESGLVNWFASTRGTSSADSAEIDGRLHAAAVDITSRAVAGATWGDLLVTPFEFSATLTSATVICTIGLSTWCMMTFNMESFLPYIMPRTHMNVTIQTYTSVIHANQFIPTNCQNKHRLTRIKR